jgi:hypothetical protein
LLYESIQRKRRGERETSGADDMARAMWECVTGASLASNPSQVTTRYVKKKKGKNTSRNMKDLRLRGVRTSDHWEAQGRASRQSKRESVLVKQRLLSTVSGLVQGQGPIDEGDVGADTAEGSKTDRKTKKERERERERERKYQRTLSS